MVVVSVYLSVHYDVGTMTVSAQTYPRVKQVGQWLESEGTSHEDMG